VKEETIPIQTRVTEGAAQLSCQLTGKGGQYAGVGWSQILRDSPWIAGFFTASGVGGALLGTLMVREESLSFGSLRISWGDSP
jgi:hypothetical protein